MAKYEIECVICGDTFEAERSTALYCGNACKQEAYRERKQSGRVWPEEELAELRRQIALLSTFAEYQGNEAPPLAMLQEVSDPDLMRIGMALDRLQVFRAYGTLPQER